MLLNDSVYWEAAGHLADRMRGEDLGEKIQSGYMAIMLKPLSEEKLRALMLLYKKALETRQGSQRQPGAGGGGFSAEPGPKAGGSANGLTRRPEGDALTVVASALLNLDEVVTKN